MKWIFVFSICLISLFCLFKFGNSQWGLPFYWVQNYSLFDSSVVVVNEEPESSFTGSHRIWRRDGTVQFMTEMTSGSIDGYKYWFRDDGERYYSISFFEMDRIRWTATYFYKSETSDEIVRIERKYLARKNGELVKLIDCIYDPNKNIDQSKKFGIPVE